ILQNIPWASPPSHTTVSSEPSPAVAYEGSRVVLQCDATGSNLSYTWYFNQEEVTPSTGPLFHTTGNQLVLDELTPEHSGLYSCYAWSVLEDIRRVSVMFVHFFFTFKIHRACQIDPHSGPVLAPGPYV
uniref:Ig-like domain-containing protein n=1 Tax=Cynoglossus semilaevis TaxID=244447 RepID=A0A3P8V1A3_CYNSE